jgi:Flp pilus assembly protein TadG
MRILKDQTGSAIILVALMITAFFSLLALVIDGGNLYLEKAKIQKVVDAAALAGAQELPSNSQQADQQARATIEKNNEDVTNYSINFNENYKSIEVIGKKSQPLFFASALGFTDVNLEAKAKVTLAPVTSAIGVVPVGVEYDTDLQFGTQKKLKVGDSTVGNFGALVLTAPGAKDYVTDFKYGYSFELKVNDILDTQTGNIVGPTESAVDYLIGFCPNATYTNVSSGCKRVVLIPVYQPVYINQNQVKQVKVVGFAFFFIEEVTSDSEIVGRFIKKSYSGAHSSSQQDYGAYGYKLSR